MAQPEPMTVEIFTVEGTKVATPVEGRAFAAGSYNEAITTASLAPGVYTLRISADDFSMVRTRQFVVVR